MMLVKIRELIYLLFYNHYKIEKKVLNSIQLWIYNSYIDPLSMGLSRLLTLKDYLSFM